MFANMSQTSIFRRLSRAEWRAAARPDTPALPWVAEDGRRIAGFMLVPIPECPTGTTVAFLDAEGKTIEVRNEGPLFEMAQALAPKLAELTLLPE
jgi:hypothetical protein